MNMHCNVLAAEYTNGSKTRSPTLNLNRIIDGRRSPVIGFNVANRREARQIAKQYGATPWNF
jgi:hypothetical protein